MLMRSQLMALHAHGPIIREKVEMYYSNFDNLSIKKGL